MNDVSGSNAISPDAPASADAGHATGGVMSDLGDGFAMKAVMTGCLSVALGLAGSLAAPSEACAGDTTVAKMTTETAQPAAKSAAKSGAKSARKTAKRPHAKGARARASAALLDPVPAPVVDPHTAAGAALAPAGAVSAPAAQDPATLLDVDETTAAGEDGCKRDGDSERPPQCLERPKSEIELLPEVILKNIVDTPVLGAFVTPVTEGVTFETVEGLPSVTVLVKPTKITRGSGLVAVGTF
jgi:hypothetical protein